jgi:hypothetical protein
MATSVVLNIPFGSWRNLTRKFSIAWFISIHLPIPVIIIMRRGIFELDYLWVIPFSIAAAIFGQIIGKRLALFGYRAEAETVDAGDIKTVEIRPEAEA